MRTKEDKKTYMREYARRTRGHKPRIMWSKDPIERAEAAKAGKKRYYDEHREEMLAKGKKSHQAYRLRVYGVTPEQYESMKQAQGNLCAICKQPDSRGRDLGVDHNHTTGQVRALLCYGCNIGLGFFKESPLRLSEAAKYIERFIDVSS